MNYYILLNYFTSNFFAHLKYLNLDLLSQDKLQLRATNEQLMARLRQIWCKYKSQLVHNGNSANELSSEEAAANDERNCLSKVHQSDTLQVIVDKEFVFD